MTTRTYCNIPSLNASIPLAFNNAEVMETVLAAVSERVSVVRLPYYEWTSSPNFRCSEQVSITATLLGSDISVYFSSQAFGGSYVVPLDGLHWDFWKAVISSLFASLTSQRNIIAHAACINVDGTVILLPGNSGDGKSSLSFACLAREIPVYASELCFLQGRRIRAGNLAVSIDQAALDYFGIPAPSASAYKDGRVLADTVKFDDPREVDQIIFPRVNAGPFRLRHITARRARMLLYENIVGQLSISQLLCQNSIPIRPLPTEAQICQIAEQVSLLARKPGIIVEGKPAEIVEWITNKEF